MGLNKMDKLTFNNEGLFYPSTMSLEGLMLYITNSENYKNNSLVAKQRKYVIDYLNRL